MPLSHLLQKLRRSILTSARPTSCTLAAAAAELHGGVQETLTPAHTSNYEPPHTAYPGLKQFFSTYSHVEYASVTLTTLPRGRAYRDDIVLTPDGKSVVRDL